MNRTLLAAAALLLAIAGLSGLAEAKILGNGPDLTGIAGAPAQQGTATAVILSSGAVVDLH